MANTNYSAMIDSEVALKITVEFMLFAVHYIYGKLYMETIFCGRMFSDW